MFRIIKNRKSWSLFLLLMFMTSLFTPGISLAATQGNQEVSNASAAVDSVKIIYKGSSSVLKPGQKIALKAEGYDANGNKVALKKVTWSTSDPAVLRVTTSGAVTAKAAGEATITITYKSGSDVLTDSIDFTVADPNRVEKLAIIYKGSVISDGGDPISLKPGDTAQLQAAGYNYADKVVKNVKFTWTVDDSTIASVDRTGKVKALSQGETTVTASYTRSDGQELTAEALIKIVDPNQPSSIVIQAPSYLGNPPYHLKTSNAAQLQAICYNASGKKVFPTNLGWRSSDESVATVTSGVVTGIQAGNATITAFVPNADGTDLVATTADFIIEDDNQTPIITKLVITANATTPISLEVGDRVAIMATAYDAKGKVVPLDSVEWIVTGGAKSAISFDPANAPKSDLVGLSPGSGSFKAHLPALANGAGEIWSNELSYKITQPPQKIVRLEVKADGPTNNLKIGDPVAVHAIAYDSANKVVPLQSVQWKTSTDGIVKFDNSGSVDTVVRATANGFTNVYAELPASTANPTAIRSSDLPFTVQGSTLTRVEARVDGATNIKVGDRVAVHAIGYDANNNIVPLQNVTWKSSNWNTVSTENPYAIDTFVRGIAPGNATVHVEAQGTANVVLSNDIPFTVVQATPQIARFEITANGSTAALNLTAGAVIPLEARAYDTTGNPVNITNVQWVLQGYPATALTVDPPYGARTSLKAMSAGNGSIKAHLIPTDATGTADFWSNEIPVTVTPNTPQIARFEITANGSTAALNLTAGMVVPVEARAYDTAGNPVNITNVQWVLQGYPTTALTVDPPYGAHTSLKAMSAGSGSIKAHLIPTDATATGDFWSNEIPVTITAGDSQQIVKIELTSNGSKGPITFTVGSSINLDVKGYNANGQEIPITASVDYARASVQPLVSFNPPYAAHSVMTATTAGNGVIIASIQTDSRVLHSNPLPFVVTPNNQPQITRLEIAANGSTNSPINVTQGSRTPLQATAYDAAGNIVPLQNVTWMSTNIQTLNFEPTTLSTPGTQAIAVTGGTSTVTAQVNGPSGPIVSNAITFNINADPITPRIHHIAIMINGSQDPVSMTVGQTLPIEVKGYDTAGNIVPVSAEWRRTMDSLISVSFDPANGSTSTIHADQPGTVGIQAYVAPLADGSGPFWSNAIQITVQ